MAEIFGIDFGTTNSVASVVLGLKESEGQEIAVLANREDRRPHPSVIWYNGTETIVGRRAKNALGELVTGASGDFVRSPKTLLGGLNGIRVGGMVRTPVDLVADVFNFLRRDALSRGQENQEFDRAVVSIPVSMKGHARRDLRDGALRAGVRIQQFVHEPLAALYGHLRSPSEGFRGLADLEGRSILVFDWGGGTLDLTLCQVTTGSLVQMANLGDPTVGGDQFDLRLEKLVRMEHEKLYSGVDGTKFQPTGRARLIQACEDGKIALSSRDSTLIFAQDVFAIPGAAAHVEVEVTRQRFAEATEDLIRRGLQRVEEILAKADITGHGIEFCLATGGTVDVPAIRDGLVEIFGPGRCRFAENADTVISEGCAWIAHDGVSLSIAKSLSVLHAGDVFYPVIPSGTPLPCEGYSLNEHSAFYCVDPRDGFAKFLLARSRWPDDRGDMIPYGSVAVRVDPFAKPLRERLKLNVTIDHNLIVTARASSEGLGDEREIEIHDLEFGLVVAGQCINEIIPSIKRGLVAKSGDVRIRANVTDKSDGFSLVPGEVLKQQFPLITERTALQRDEKGYYDPCSICGRSIHEILRDGCERCGAWDPELRLNEAANRKVRYEDLTLPDTWVTSTDTAGKPAELDLDSAGVPREVCPNNPDLLTHHVKTLGFSVRVTNCMKDNGIETLEQLISMPELEIAVWRSLGTSGLREIKARVEALGLKLK